MKNSLQDLIKFELLNVKNKENNQNEIILVYKGTIKQLMVNFSSETTIGRH